MASSSAAAAATGAAEGETRQAEPSADASAGLPSGEVTAEGLADSSVESAAPGGSRTSAASGGFSTVNSTEGQESHKLDSHRSATRKTAWEGSNHPEEEEPQPGSSKGHMDPHVKREGRVEAAAATSGPCVVSGEPMEGGVKHEEPLDVASLFLSPSDDLDSWAFDGKDLLLPSSSFVSADAISQHRGPMTLGRVALFIFSLFQGDVRMGLLSAQGRLLAWRCLLYLAEQHDRQCIGGQPQQQPQQAGSQAAGVAPGDPGMRRRRLQRESVATSKGRRSVRHAFLLDRSGASRTGAAGPSGGGSGFSPGANDEWGEAEEEPAACVSLREDLPGEIASEQALAPPAMSVAMSLQQQLDQTPGTLGFEPDFSRFIGGSIDRRWALQQRSLRIPAEGTKGEAATGKEEPLDMRLEEFGAATALKMWPRVEALPERIFVGLPIQVACWVGWGRTDGGEAGRMLWRDCEVTQLLPGGSFRARCFVSAGEPRQLTCHIRDFIPPRVPVPSPHECAWRLVPMEADPARDIYPGACLSVGLSATNSPQQEQQQEGARAYFVDVVVQDVYFTLEQTTRARQALAEAREREEASGGRGATSSRRILGCSDTGGPVEGLRPNCPVRAMRVMVLRNGGGPNEFALIKGRTIYKLGYDLYAHTGFVRESATRQQRQGGARLAWAIPRALSPAAPERLKGAPPPGASLTTGSVEDNTKRWQYKTQEDSRDWVNFPPFLVAYMAYDCAARYTETHPLLLRYLQPELDLSALSRGVWRLCLPQYEHPNIQPILLPHPSDMPLQEDSKPLHASSDAGGAPAEGVVTLESPYARSNAGMGGGVEAREEVPDSLYAAHASESPQPVGSTQSSGDTSGRASVLGINHLASLLCSAGDSPPPRELLSKALPFFRGLLPHLGSQLADTWQLEVARAAIHAADQAKELYVDEQETEAQKLRRQGVTFGGSLGGSAATERGREPRETERPAGTAETESGEAWEWMGSSGSRYPTSSDISRFLLRTSGHGVGGGTIRARGMEATAPQSEVSGASGGGGRRRPLEAVAGAISGESGRGSELGMPEGRGRVEETMFVPGGAGGGESDFHGVRRSTASASVRAVPEQTLAASRARGGLSPAVVAVGTIGASPGTARRRPVGQREEEEDFQPPARAAPGPRQASGSGRAGVARRAARNVSYTALAGMEPVPEEAAFYRPVKRIARSDSHAAGVNPSAADSWEHPHAKDFGTEAVGAERHHGRTALQQWAAAQRQATAVEERGLSTQGNRGAGDRAAEGSISTDQLHEALKGFVQSIKAGTSPPVVSVPPMARNRSFAASH